VRRARVRQFFANPNVKARCREDRCCIRRLNQRVMQQRADRPRQTCRSRIAVCAGSRPPSSCTGRTIATEAQRQRMEARRITTGSARRLARARSATMGCGPGAVEIGGCSTSSTPGPPSHLRSRWAAPPTANRTASADLWPRRPACGGHAGRRPFSRVVSPRLGASSVARLRVQPTLPASFPGTTILPQERGRLAWAPPLPAPCGADQTLNRSRNSAARSGSPVISRLDGALSGLSALTQASWEPVMRASASWVSRRSMRARPRSRTNV
jgi:hypothetical protein